MILDDDSNYERIYYDDSFKLYKKLTAEEIAERE